MLCCETKTCLDSCAMHCGCVHIEPASIARCVVLCLCFMQPLFLMLVKLIQNAYSIKATSSLQFSYDFEQLTCLKTMHGNTTILQQISEAHMYEFDFLWLAFLSAVAQSMACYMWVMCEKENYVASSTQWDTDLHENMHFYEISYFIEVFFSSLASLSVIAVWVSFAELLFCTCCVSIFIFYFLIHSKFQRNSHADVLYASIFMFFLLLIFCYVFYKLRGFCTLSVLVAVVYSMTVALNVNVHYIADANFLVSTILTVRFFCSICINFTFLAILISGLDDICSDSPNMCLNTESMPQLFNLSTY